MQTAKSYRDRTVSFWLNIYSNLPKLSSEDARRRRLFLILAFPGGLALLGFGIYNLLYDNTFGGLIDIIFSLALVASGACLVYVKKPNFIFRANTLALTLVIIIWCLDGGIHGEKLLWAFCFPPMALIMFGRKEGVVWNLLLFGVIQLIFLAGDQLDVHAYSIQFKIRFVCAFLLLITVTYLYESLLHAYQGDLSKKQSRLDAEKKKLVQATDSMNYAHESLLKSEEKFRFLTEKMADIVWTLDLDYRTTYVSPSIEKVLGFTPEERKRQPLEEMVKPESLNKIQSIFIEELRHDGNADADPDRSVIIEVEYYHKDGSTVWMENIIKAMRNHTGAIDGVYGVSRDITERKQAEEELQRTLKKLQGLESIINRSPAMIFLWPIQEGWPVEFVSDNVKQILGYSADDFILEKVSWPEITHPEDVPRLEAEVAKYLEEGITEFNQEYRLIVKSGDIRWMRDRNKVLADSNGNAIHIQSIVLDVTERKQAEELLCKAHDELELRVWERTAELVEANEQLKREIEERKQTEEALQQSYKDLRSIQAQLIQTAKLASIGELSAGVAHELNQPLMVIRGNAQLIQRSLGKGELETDELLKQFELVEKNTKRMINIINHLRTFSRQSSKEFSRVSVNKVIEECFLMVGEQLRLHNIEVEKDLGSDLPKVHGDSNQLEQVFLNLITNARDAIDGRRQGEVEGPEGDSQKTDRIEILTRVSDDNKDAIEILVKDNGNGIPEESLEEIFDPFFTTKEVGQGTGLGLSVSYGIIEEHKGKIKVAETGPEGTTFRIKLPILNTV